MAAPKPQITGNAHRLPFDALPAQKLEELCLWLVRRDGYERAEYLGEAGSEQGRDVVAWKGGRRVVFQCKRVKTFGLATAKKEIEKLRALPHEEQPDELVFVASTAISTNLRKDIRAVWGAEDTCHFWAGGELDERVKRYPEIVREFFQVGGSWLSWGFALAAIELLAILAAWLWLRGEPRMLIVARDLEDRVLAGCRVSYGGIQSLPTNQAGATELGLPPGHKSGQQIKLHLLSGPMKDEEWFLVTDMVNVPARGSLAELVLMPRSELRRMAAEARDVVPAVSSDRNDPGASWRTLLEVASRYGLTENQLEAAIRSFRETASDAKDRGIAAYLEGRYSAAETLLNEVAEKKEDDLVETLRYLGASQYEQAKYDAATKSFEKALALRGEDSILLGWLGGCLHQLARWREAEPLMQRALAIAETSFGTEHSNVAADLNNLAQVLQAMNRTAEAEPLMRRALAIDEATFGIEHPNVAIYLNNLALLLQAMNRLAEAEPLMRRALAIDETSFGTEHHNVARNLNNLAQVLQATNRLAEAEPLMRRALAIAETSFGTEHPNVGASLNNLAQLLQATNRLVEAEPLMRLNVKILVGFTRHTGHEHPNLRAAFANYEELLRKLGRSEDAIRSTLLEIGWPLP